MLSEELVATIPALVRKGIHSAAPSWSHMGFATCYAGARPYASSLAGLNDRRSDAYHSSSLFQWVGLKAAFVIRICVNGSMRSLQTVSVWLTRPERYNVWFPKNISSSKNGRCEKNPVTGF